MSSKLRSPLFALDLKNNFHTPGYLREKPPKQKSNQRPPLVFRPRFKRHGKVKEIIAPPGPVSVEIGSMLRARVHGFALFPPESKSKS